MFCDFALPIRATKDAASDYVETRESFLRLL
jgi:hypothetical protein